MLFWYLRLLLIFELKIIEKILSSKEDISIAVDMNWEKKYVGRTEHPKSEAENVELNNNEEIIKIKKNILWGSRTTSKVDTKLDWWF